MLRMYPHAAEILPPCWAAHDAVAEELDWLQWDWTNWAVNPEARSRDAADYRRPVRRELQRSGYAPDALFIERMAPDAADGGRPGSPP